MNIYDIPEFYTGLDYWATRDTSEFLTRLIVIHRAVPEAIRITANVLTAAPRDLEQLEHHLRVQWNNRYAVNLAILTGRARLSFHEALVKTANRYLVENFKFITESGELHYDHRYT